MSGAAHGFIRPPPLAASAGGPAGSPPRLCARQQARTAARDGDDKDEDNPVQRAMMVLTAGNTRALRCAGSRRPVTHSSMIAGQRAMTKRGAYKSKQQKPLRVEGGRAARLHITVFSKEIFLPIYSNFSIPAVFLSIPVITAVICSQ